MKVKATVYFEWETEEGWWSDKPETTERYAEIIHKAIEEDPEFMMEEKMTVVEVLVE